MQISVLREGVTRWPRTSQRSAQERRLALLADIEARITKMCPDYAKFESSMRHFVGRYLSDEKPKSTLLGIVSPERGAGRTSVSLAVSSALADLYETVVLVEIASDGGLAEELLLPAGPGLRQFLASNDLEIDSVLRPPGAGNLWLLPMGAERGPDLSLDGLARTRSLLSTLRGRFDIVVVDLPAVLASEEAPALVRQMDCAVLVANAGKTKMEDLARTVELCGEVPIRGLLLNRYRRQPAWVSSLVDIRGNP